MGLRTGTGATGCIAGGSSFLSADWLEGDLPPLPSRDLAVAGQWQLRRAAAFSAQLDLALAKELRLLVGRPRTQPETDPGPGSNSIAQLGHSRPQDFALERLGCSWSHLQELMLLAKRLEQLPSLHAAFVAGALSRSKVREIMRIAAPETDAGWAAFARGRSVRELKAAIAEWKKRDDPSAPVDDPADSEDADHAQRVRWRCTSIEAAIWKGWGRAMMRDILGRSVPDHVMAEALAAEMLTSCDAPHEPGQDDAAPRVPDPGLSALNSPDRSNHGRRHARLNPKKLARLARRRKLFRAPALPHIPTSEGCTDAWQHLRVIRHIQALRHGLAWERSRLLFIFQGRGLHRSLGLAAHEHVEYVLGLSPKDVQHSMELHSQLMLLPGLSESWREGTLAEREVRVLARIATRATEHAWIDHASRCSRNRLEAEVDWHLAIRATLPWSTYLAGTGGLPLDGPSSPARFELDWREIFGCRERARRSEKVLGTFSVPEADADVDLEPEAPWRRHRLVTISFDAPASVAALWWQALAATRRLLGDATSDGECVHRMLLEFAQAQHGTEAEQRLAAHAIIERDGWRCSMPHCRARSPLHVHHVRFRSRGGGDEDWNLITLCDGCHQLLHAGHVSLVGRAPNGLILCIDTGSTPDALPRERWSGGLRLAEGGA